MKRKTKVVERYLNKFIFYQLSTQSNSRVKSDNDYWCVTPPHTNPTHPPYIALLNDLGRQQVNQCNANSMR